MKARVGIQDSRGGAGGSSDLVHVGIKVEGTPAGGSFTVFAARIPSTPAGSRLSVPATDSGGGWWEVTLPTEGLWYLYLHDTGGWSDEYALWTTTEDTQLVGERIRDILIEHRAGLDAALRPYYNALPPTKADQQDASEPVYQKPRVIQIIYGLLALKEEYPAIIVHDGETEKPYAATGFCRQVTYNFNITVMIWHQDRLSSLLPAVTNLGGAVQSILNLPEYNALTLSDGRQLNMAEAVPLRPVEDAVNGGWGAEATIQWKGSRLTQAKIAIP